MVSMFKRIQFFLLVLLMTGCASNRHMPEIVGSGKSYEERVSLYNSLDCCTPLNELNVTRLENELTISMEENGTLVSINNVKSNYLLFELPEDMKTHYYGIRSFYINHEFAYIPKVTALDKNYSIIGSTDASYIDYQHQTLVWDDSHFWLYFKFNLASNSAPRYFIIHMNAPIGTMFQTIPKDRTNIEMTFINGQPISYANQSTSRSFPTLTSPSGVLQLQKLNSWNKPVNDSIFYEF